MLTLRTLGGLSIEGGDEAAVAGAALQRRPLALLALLAAAGERGRGRDDLLLHLWPDSTPERGRNVLKQTVYALRRDLKAPELILTEHDTLLLNPAVIGSDIAEFGAAMERGDFNRAAELYRGPFLEGFHLRESPEFDRWLQVERGRLAAEFARAVDVLASRAAETDEHERAAELWSRLLVTDPLDPRATTGLMEALAAAGDREGALRQAHVHEVLRREQLGEAPDPGVAELAERLRHTPQPHPPKQSRRRPRETSLAALGLFLVVLVGSLAEHHDRGGVDGLDPDLLVVAPYQVLDPALHLWREGMVDVLARNLDGAGELRTVSPSVALSRWRGRPDRGTAAELGRRTGAGFAVVGSVLRAGRDSVRVTATVVESASNQVVCEVERRGPILHMDLVTDSLTLALLRELERRRGTGVVPPSFSGRTVSLEALKAYLRGEQFYRHARWDSAQVYYENAVAHDSTFALALRRLGQVLGWQHVTVDPVALGYLLRAGALNRGLTPRDSLLVAADSLLAAASLSTGALARWTLSRRLFATLRETVRRYPDASGAWIALGEAGYHFGVGPGLGVPEREILAAFDRAIRFDPTFAGAYIHPVELGFNLGGRPLGLRYARRYLALDPQEPQHRGVRLVLRLTDSAQADPLEIERLLDTASADAIVSARTILRRWPDSAEIAVRLSRALAEGRPSRYPLFSDTAFMRRRLAEELAFRGHLREAARVLGDREFPIFAELAYLGAVPPNIAQAAFARWAERDSRYARLALPWWSARGDTAVLGAFFSQAARRARRSRNQEDLARTRYDTAAAGAHLHLARRDTAAALGRFRALPDSLCSECYMDRLVRARLLARTGAVREALTGLTEPLDAFLTPMEVVFALERGRVAERMGARPDAARAFQFVAEAWLHADPELSAWVAEARQASRRVARRAGL